MKTVTDENGVEYAVVRSGMPGSEGTERVYLRPIKPEHRSLEAEVNEEAAKTMRDGYSNPNGMLGYTSIAICRVLERRLKALEEKVGK